MMFTKNGDIISNTDAYQMALPKMNNELANKYSDYFAKKSKQTKTGRLQNSFVDSGRNKVYKSEWATEAKFPECKQSMTEKEITKFFKRVVKSKTYQTLVRKGLYQTTYIGVYENSELQCSDCWTGNVWWTYSIATVLWNEQVGCPT